MKKCPLTIHVKTGHISHLFMVIQKIYNDMLVLNGFNIGLTCMLSEKKRTIELDILYNERYFTLLFKDNSGMKIVTSMLYEPKYNDFNETPPLFMTCPKDGFPLD